MKEKKEKKEKKPVPKKEVKPIITTDKWWAKDGIGNRMIKSDDTKTIELLVFHKWTKEK